MKTNIAIFSGKLAGKTSKLLGKGGSNIPGVVARKIDSSLLEKLAKQVENIVFVTGTNGKTTTANLLASILQAANKRVMNNAEGANLITGITASFVKHANAFGKLSYEYAVIEVDEATLPNVLKQMNQPKAIVVNNFFRDQLDRFGEIDILLDKVANGIKPISTKLILNGDDPFTVRLSLLGKENIYFGVDKGAHTFEQHGMSESKYCPKCGKEMDYEHVHYSQLGYFACTCGFKRPPIDAEVTSVEVKDTGVSFTVKNKAYDLNVPGIHNMYNALAAMAAAKELGISDEDIQKGLANFHSANGRMQAVMINEQLHMLNLVKNPAGVNISLEQVLSNQDDKQLVVYLNDLDLDGIDISWIWDSDYERLNRPDVKRVICSGVRAYDVAIRMKYAGISEDKIVILEDKEKAVQYAVSQNIKTYHLPNYTALEPVKKLIEKQ